MALEQELIIEVWSRDNVINGKIQDVYLGSSALSVDQLKIGDGVICSYDLLKDNHKVGKI